MAIREHYSHAIADKHKEKKRKDADARQQARKQRSSRQQLVKLDTGGYVAKKERTRLLKSEE